MNENGFMSVEVRSESSSLSIHRAELIILLGAISAFASLSVDMYLPALPTLEKVFDASSIEVQLTLASFFVAFALGRPFTVRSSTGLAESGRFVLPLCCLHWLQAAALWPGPLKRWL